MKEAGCVLKGLLAARSIEGGYTMLARGVCIGGIMPAKGIFEGCTMLARKEGEEASTCK